MIINHQKNIGLVFEAAVAYLSRESWQQWRPRDQTQPHRSRESVSAHVSMTSEQDVTRTLSNRLCFYKRI